MAETILTIDGISFPLGSARGISEQVKPIQGGEQERDWNGVLVDLTRPEFRKYAVTLSCKDQEHPTFGDVWPGTTVTVSCIKRLRQASAGTEITLIRDPVAGSVRAENPTTGARIEVVSVTGRAVVLAAAPAIVSFRPTLSCQVMDWNADTEEYAAARGWTLSLEEI